MPEPQLICTVNATIASPMPSRSAATRAGFISSAMHVDAAEDDLIEGVRRERLPRQQRPAALHGEIDRRERARTGARFQERRPAAVDDIDRSRHQLAALCSPSFLEELMHVGRLLVDRRNRFRREIVDLDHLCHGVMRGGELCRLRPG